MRGALLAFFCATALWAEPPPGYYDAANGQSGAALKSALHGIIRNGHTVISYNNLLGPLRAIWEDPANSANILLIYSDASVLKTATTWNREHLWPRSRGNSDQAGPDDSDLHYIVPCDGDVNSQRGNLFFDDSSFTDGAIMLPAQAEAPETSRDINSWEPPAAQKGDIARALFYVAVRYDGTEPNTTDMELVNGTPAGPQMARLETLLAWHNADPPDAAERTRHERVWSAYQHNRNPFIDHPEYAASIFGSINSTPIAQALATGSSAVESPVTAGAVTVQVAPAPNAALVVGFTIRGSAQGADYAVSGPGVSFDPATGTGTMTFPTGTSRAVVTLTPISDGIAEPPEDAVLALLDGSSYTTTGGPASVTFTDAPPTLPNAVIAAWNFDGPTSPTMPRYANPLAADSGAGSIRFDNWWGTIEAFGGTNEECTADVGSAVALGEASSNGRYIDVVFSAAGYGGIVVTLGVRGTATSYDIGTWSHSTDGVNFTALPGVNTASRHTVFERKRADFSAVQALSNTPSVTLRYTLSGATSQLANNRLDNLTVRATPLPRITVSASDGVAAERNSDPAVFLFTSDVPSPAGGLTIPFALGGTATAGADYTVTGAVEFDRMTSAGTIVIPAGATSAALTISPEADNAPTEFDESVTAQVSAVTSGSRYVVGAPATATATIRDDTPYAAAWAARFPGFASQPGADDDGDGLANLAECAFDLDPLRAEVGALLQPGTRELPDPNAGGALRTFPVVTFTRRTDADAPRATPQRSGDLATWSEDLVLVEMQAGLRPNTERVTFRAPDPLASNPVFLRVKMSAP